MIGLLQRVRQAQVAVAGTIVAEIGSGLLVFVGVRPDDTDADALRLLQRLLAYRVFADTGGRMNLSLSDTGGGLLLVPQFTLAADTRRGARPSFSTAAPPALARARYEHLVRLAQQMHPLVSSGSFGADMAVSLINDGPVTFWLES